jgi:hypothetical protein
MSTNNNSSINNSTEAAKYTVHIADRSGHTTAAELTIDATVQKIVENAESNARWVFINGEKHEFSGSNYASSDNLLALKQKLEALQDPAILLTGVLVGGNEE